MSIFVDVREWIIAVIKAWYGWVGASATAGFLGVGQNLGWWSPTGHTYWWLIGCGFVVSMFQAWRGEHTRAGGRTPDFKIEILGTLSNLVTGNTVVLLIMRIVNKGAPSSIIGWKANYKAIDHEGVASQVFFNNDLHFNQGETTFVFKPSDGINFRTNEPIETGGFVAGRLLVLIPGNRQKDLPTGDCEISVTIFDYLDKPYTATYKGGKATTQIEYITGEPISAGQVGRNLNPNDLQKTKSPEVYKPKSKKRR
jgi:hypothetical protein